MPKSYQLNNLGDVGQIRQFALHPPRIIEKIPEIELQKGWGMNKERFLTVRWNNWLALGLGIPALAYAVVALSTSLASELGGFIGIVVIGVLY